MTTSSKSLIGIGIGLAVVIVVAVFLYTSGSSNKVSTPLSVPPNATQATPNATQSIQSTTHAAPSNATLATSTVRHFQVKVNELINVGERTG